MQLTRLNILILGVSLVIVGIVLHLFHFLLSDFILGIGLLLTLSAAFMFTFKPGNNDVKDDQ